LPFGEKRKTETNQQHKQKQVSCFGFGLRLANRSEKLPNGFSAAAAAMVQSTNILGQR